MIEHGWTWTLSEAFPPSDWKDHATKKLTSLSTKMEAWLGGFPLEVLKLTWSMMLEQDEKHTRPSPTLEVLVAVLCTVREQDFQSLTKAIDAIKCLRQGDGTVANIASCVTHCAYGDDGHGTCREECILRLAFVKGMHKNTNLHVRAMREVVRLIDGIISEQQSTLFPRGYIPKGIPLCKCHDLGDVVVDESEVENPSGHRIHPNSLCKSQWLAVPGAAEVVFRKVLALSRVGEWALCEDPVGIAVDSKLLGLVVQMGSKSTAEEFGEGVFGFKKALPFKALAKRVKSHVSLKHLGVVVAATARGDHKRKKFSSDGLRSKLATHVQDNYVGDMARMFCEELGYDVRNARHVDGLRESLRFIYDLFSFEKTTPPPGALGRISGFDVEKCTLSSRDTFVPTHGMGPAYVPMNALLTSEDVAYWWQHPGQLVRVNDTSTLNSDVMCGDDDASQAMTIFLGATRDESLKAAMHSCGSVVDFVRALSDRSVAVCYWGMHSSLSRESKGSWGFEMKTLSANAESVGHDSVTSMLCAFYSFRGHGRMSEASIRARVREIMKGYDGDLEQVMFDLESKHGATFKKAYTKLRECSGSVRDEELEVEDLPAGHANGRFVSFQDGILGRMFYLLWTRYKISDPRLIFELGEKMLEDGDAQCQELEHAIAQCVPRKPWTLMRREAPEWSFAAGSQWNKIDLGKGLPVVYLLCMCSHSSVAL